MLAASSASFFQGFGYAPSADGQRFLLSKPFSTSKPPITVVLNWQSELDQ